jgi:hypothetical protein
MRARNRQADRVIGIVFAVVSILGADRPALATPASGVTAAVLSRAVVPAFEARRRFGTESDDTRASGVGNLTIELAATETIDVVTVLFTIPPGGHSGWHTHPGPAIFTVSNGTLTMYDAHDASCTPEPFAAGSGSLEAGTTSHHHILRNETDSNAETIVTFLLPPGAPIRIDLPDPGHCRF